MADRSVFIFHYLFFIFHFIRRPSPYPFFDHATFFIVAPLSSVA
jgi:hypothetical protein